MGRFVIENLVAAAPVRTAPSYYRTAAGAEIDLILEIPGHGLWAFDIRRAVSARCRLQDAPLATEYNKES